MALPISTGLYLTLLCSTMALPGSTGLYLTRLHSTLLYLTLLRSTMALLDSTMALLDSTPLYHGSTWPYSAPPWLYLTLLRSTMALLDSTLLYHGSTWLYSAPPWLYIAAFIGLCFTVHHSTMAQPVYVGLIVPLCHSSTRCCWTLFKSTPLYHCSTWLYSSLPNFVTALIGSTGICYISLLHSTMASLTGLYSVMAPPSTSTTCVLDYDCTSKSAKSCIVAIVTTSSGILLDNLSVVIGINWLCLVCIL